eukprot:721158-Alexandrium_andersonii.AAC.1
MSASLVGSEMCIRDSPLRGLQPPRTPPQKRLRRPAPEALFGGSGGQSVSYTHLTLPTICSV